MTPQQNPAADAANTPVPGIPGAATPPAAGAQPGAKDPAALEREVEQLKASTAELQRTAEFWRSKAQTPATTDKPAAAAATEEEVDLLDLIATKGAKGLKEYLKKEGYASKDEVDAIVNSKAKTMSEETQLLRDYPDLANHDSEFFKATAAEYGQLKAQGVPENLAMRMAARSTALSFLESGKAKTKQQRSDEEKQQREQERRARIAAQAGDRGGRAAGEDESDDEVTPAEQAIIRGMLVGQPGKDGKPMDLAAATEAFKARAKSGVNVSRRR